MFSVAGLTFHWYGLIVGIAIALAWQLIETRYKELMTRDQLVSTKELEKVMIWVVCSGLVGARMWHVATDWQLYQSNWWAVFFLWQGGMSIIGAILLGLIAIMFFFRWQSPESWQSKTWFLLDLAAFGLPLGQAVGRLGNWVNQELYGLPTSLPWGLYISPEARLAGYEQFTHFHPLFAYEAVALALFGSWVWFNRKVVFVGRGELALLYLSFYSLLRFGLDFLRLEKTTVGVAQLGVNQLVVAILFIASLTWLAFKKNEKARS